MKKTLAAVAVLGAFAGSALAADVTLYGKVDLGVKYTHAEDVDGNKTDNWGLDSGISSGSRFGIKGSEQISEGLTVGFQLEQGFDADDGQFSESDKAFRRESRLYVATDFGTLHFGRFGALDSGTGSVDVAADFTASGTGYGGINDQSTVLKTYGRMDNSIAYTSPEFAGVTVHAMASLKQNETTGKFGADFKVNEGKEASHEVNRYYGLGVTGQWGALGAGLVVSQLDIGSKNKTSYKDMDDALNVTAGVNYDFGVTKAFLAANYYDAGEVIAGQEESQWGVSLSAATPLVGGTLETAIGYSVQKTELAAADQEDKIFDIGAFYKYPLSKRTYLYTGAGYTQEENDDGDKAKEINVISGICHSF